MGRFFVAVLGALLISAVGCRGGGDKQHGAAGHKHGDAMKASSTDACQMCPGKQTAKADGTCPVCAMQTAMPSSSTTMPTPGPQSAADACTHCAGMQTAKADGTCPACGMQVAKK